MNAVESMGLVSNREDGTEPARVSTKVLDGDGRGVSGLLPPSRWHLGKNQGERREKEIRKYSVWENEGWRGGNQMLGRRGGDAGGFEGLIRKLAQLQGLGREQGNSSWVRTTFVHLLPGHERHRPCRGDTEDWRGRRL